ncbi:hypothetical protein ACK3TF_005092 [Chlorella vulgaris]
MSAHFGLAAANVFPAVRKHFFTLREQGPQGRDVYQAYASGLFLFFALWEGSKVACSWLPHTVRAFDPASAAISVMAPIETTWGISVPWVAVIIAAGSAICKLITEVVEQHGLGDGTGLVIALGVAVNYLHYIASSAHQLALTSVLPFAASMLLCCSLIAVLSWAQSVELRLPITFYRTRSNHVQQEHPLIQALCKRDVQHRDRTVEFALDGNNEQHLLMRLSPSGARSLLFANFWAALLQTPLSWVGIASPFDHAWGFAALVFLTEAVTVFDTMPRQMSRFLATVS